MDAAAQAAAARRAHAPGRAAARRVPHQRGPVPRARRAASPATQARLAALGAALTSAKRCSVDWRRPRALVAQAEEAQRQLGVLQNELAERKRLLGEQRFRAGGAHSSWRRSRSGIASSATTKRATASCGRARHELVGADRERQLLEQARLSAEHLDAQIAELTASLKRLEEECAADDARATIELRADVAGVARRAAAAGRARRRRLLERTARATRRATSASLRRRKLDNCAFLERKQRDSLARQDALRREQSIFGDLAYAFGRRGVQAMIIETAIPEIEEEANRILARMTDGRMHVKFETQRDVRSGMGTIETLDIKIADELGTRSYEMFSGGEGFRVNFAIRIALSRLLAHRAGTRLQTLVVDEGFGSQDQEGRDRIVEAIQAIEPEFEKILVITHLEDLRDRFPVRIEVSKTPAGSTYAVR